MIGDATTLNCSKVVSTVAELLVKLLTGSVTGLGWTQGVASMIGISCGFVVLTSCRLKGFLTELSERTEANDQAANFEQRIMLLAAGISVVPSKGENSKVT